MNKVFLVQGRKEDIALLKACYRILLPECEVDILLKSDFPKEETGKNTTLDDCRNSGRIIKDPLKIRMRAPHTH